MSAISPLSANVAYCAQSVLPFVKTSLGQGLLPIWNVISSVIQLAEARFHFRCLRMKSMILVVQILFLLKS